MQPTTPLLTGFTGTGENLQTSDVGTKTYNIFRKTYPAGQVNLGPKPGAGDGKSMYFVLVGYPEDAQAPSVPTNVQATAQSQTSVQVTWTASTDNIGVAGYRVSRNGSQVGTSGITSYADSGLSPSTTYSYTVSAYDAAGNGSALSSPPAMATTLAAMRIAEIKELPDTSSVGLASKVVTAIFSRCFYVEEADRHTGIKVVPLEMPSGLEVGATVDIGGTMQTGSNGERYIGNATATLN